MDVERLLYKFKGWEKAEAVLIRFPAQYYTMQGLSTEDAKSMRRLHSKLFRTVQRSGLSQGSRLHPGIEQWTIEFLGASAVQLIGAIEPILRANAMTKGWEIATRVGVDGDLKSYAHI